MVQDSKRVTISHVLKSGSHNFSEARDAKVLVATGHKPLEDVVIKMNLRVIRRIDKQVRI